jgi:pimeloyl-ACP methyl ester carboxylesterase
MASLMGFLRAYVRPGRADLTKTETTYRRGELRLPATLYRPRGTRRLPGWVVLHGLTYTGREHPALVHFVEAIAAAGNLVLVPDIPEWRDLRVAPAVTHDTIRAAVRALHDRTDVLEDRIGLFAFSFGATQSLIAAADPDVRTLLRALAAWGGYHDVRALFRFGILGEHELDGREYRVRPDPYGAWIMSGNYLTHIPGHEGDTRLAAAARELALEAGRRRRFAGDPIYDESKRRLRASLDPTDHALFDLIAPTADTPPPDPEWARDMAQQLADAALRVDPLMDPRPFLPRPGVNTLLAHGRTDRLIPFTETIRLSRALPADQLEGCTITALFEHSGGTNRALGPLGVVAEGIRFLAVLGRILHLT